MGAAMVPNLAGAAGRIDVGIAIPPRARRSQASPFLTRLLRCLRDAFLIMLSDDAAVRSFIVESHAL